MSRLQVLQNVGGRTLRTRGCRLHRRFTQQLLRINALGWLRDVAYLPGRWFSLVRVADISLRIGE